MKHPVSKNRPIKTAFLISLLISLVSGSLISNKAAVVQVTDKLTPSLELSPSATGAGFFCHTKQTFDEKRICLLEKEVQKAKESGNYEQVIRFLEKALSIAEKHIFWDKFWGGSNSGIRMSGKMDELSEHLGDAYFRRQKYLKAIDMYRNASESILRYSEMDKRLINLYIKLSKSLYITHNIAAADQDAQRALRIIEVVIKSSEYNERSYKREFIPVGASVLSDQYQELYLLLQRIKVKRNQEEKAFEFSERGRTLGLVSLLSVKDDPFSQFETPNYDISKLREVAKSQNATFVEYSVIDDKTLFIYVLQSSGRLHFRAVNLNSVDTVNRDSINGIYGQSHNLYVAILLFALAVGIVFAIISTHPRRPSIVLSSIIIILMIAVSFIPQLSKVAEFHSHKNTFPMELIHKENTAENNQFSLKGLTQESFLVVRGESTEESPSLVAKKNCKDDRECLQALYKILIKPIQELLPSDPAKHIVFFPDKALYRVPFAALTTIDGRYLIEEHTIRIFPSIQLLDILRKQRKDNPSPANTALIVGNPLVPKETLIDIGVKEELKSLPYATTEAKAIGSLLGIKPLIGPEATERKILNLLPQARLVHFATHAIVDVQIMRPTIPRRFSLDDAFPPDQYLREALLREYPRKIDAIVLTKSPKEDGLLDEIEIYGLKKLNADLVVLSACNSGIGDITTDGVIGLARPFIANGVPSVIVSLWPVYDDKTAEFMIEFYQHLALSPDKAQSLRQAMLKMIRNGDRPVDWAGFLLVGEADNGFRSNTREHLDNPGDGPRLTLKSLATSWMPKLLAEVFQSLPRFITKESLQSKVLTVEALKNAEYFPGSPAKVRLINGKYSSKGNTIGSRLVWLGETIIREDINGDGAKDAIVIIHQNAGGSGVFMDLAIVINHNGKPVHADSYGLGDRVQISDVRIKPNGIITFTITKRWGQIMKESFQFKASKREKTY